MAASGNAGKGSMDIAQQKKMWDNFMSMTVWTTVFVIVVLALLGLGLIDPPPRLK